MAATKEVIYVTLQTVSTHSHPKVAAKDLIQSFVESGVSTHSHPKVAAKLCTELRRGEIVSTHSHPKVAAKFDVQS